MIKKINLNELYKVNARKDIFIIKNYFSKDHCNYLINFFLDLLKTYKNEERISGNNWYSDVNKNESRLKAFYLYDLERLNNKKLTETFRKMYSTYKLMGYSTYLDDFEKEITISEATNYKMINPAVFVYPADNSNLKWHKHSDEIQKSQLLLNLTQPNEDYSNGETLFYNNGKPKKEDINTFNNSTICGDNLKKGDILSFPYTKWHKVHPTHNSGKKNSINCRMSLILPLSIRHSDKYPNEYL
jgi:hypothetical protein